MKNLKEIKVRGRNKPFLGQKISISKAKELARLNLSDNSRRLYFAGRSKGYQYCVAKDYCYMDGSFQLNVYITSNGWNGWDRFFEIKNS